MGNTLSERFKLAMQGPPKITQADLAKACNVKSSSVNDWISGKTKTLASRTLLAAAEFLNVRAKWLLNGDGPMRTELQKLEINLDDADFIALAQLWNKTPPHLRPHICSLAGTVQQLTENYEIEKKKGNSKNGTEQ